MLHNATFHVFATRFRVCKFTTNGQYEGQIRVKIRHYSDNVTIWFIFWWWWGWGCYLGTTSIVILNIVSRINVIISVRITCKVAKGSFVAV